MTPEPKILLVDDEVEFVQTLGERLQNRGLNILVAYNGEQALQNAAQHELDVIVLDLKIPGVNSMDLLNRLKTDHPGLEVIFLAGYFSGEEEAQALRHGAFAYLQKPLQIDKLIETIRAALSQVHLNHSEPK